MTESASNEARREERIPIDLSQPIVLDVHIPHGEVTVRAVERTDVLVSYDALGTSGNVDEEIELTIDARQNRIEVRVDSRAGAGWPGIGGDVDLDAVVGQITRAFRRGGSWSSARPGRARVATGRHGWFDITIEVPRAITGQFAIHSASGDVRIEGLTGEVALNSSSGDVRAVRTSGTLALQTASGDLLIEGANGRLSAQTASGDVRVTSARIEDFQIQTANGDILVDALLTGDGAYRAHTASGDVNLTLRRSAADGEEPAATLAFHTVSGDANVSPPFRQTDRRLWQAGTGGRGPRIDITTVSGDLVAGFAAMVSDFFPAAPASPKDDIPLTTPIPPTPPAPPAPVIAPAPPSVPAEPTPVGQDDAVRLAVLEAVERGEIDVEEALQRLEAVDSSPGM